MPARERIKTIYPGVYYIETVSETGEEDRVFYIIYRKNGRLIEEKAGRKIRDDMSAARAAGKRARRTEGEELTNKERKAIEEAEKNAERNRWTFERLWEAYKDNKPDSKSLRTDKSRYNRYIKKDFGKVEPKELIQLDVDRLRIRLMKKKSPQTVRHVLGLIKRLANFGAQKGLCQPIPFKVVMPRVNNIKTEDLTPDQLKRLMKTIEEDEHHQAGNLMKMVLYTGMRRGELFRLKWDDVDFERGFVHIRDPKGGVDQKIPLNEAARSLLNSIPRSKSPYVFPGREGGQRVDINHQLNSIREDAGLPKDFRPLHGLRHVYASMLASSGKVDMYTLQKLLTHKSPKMTQRYAHLRDETLKKAADLAGALVEDIIENVEEGTDTQIQ